MARSKASLPECARIANAAPRPKQSLALKATAHNAVAFAALKATAHNVVALAALKDTALNAAVIVVQKDTARNAVVIVVRVGVSFKTNSTGHRG